MWHQFESQIKSKTGQKCLKRYCGIIMSKSANYCLLFMAEIKSFIFTNEVFFTHKCSLNQRFKPRSSGPQSKCLMTITSLTATRPKAPELMLHSAFYFYVFEGSRRRGAYFLFLSLEVTFAEGQEENFASNRTERPLAVKFSISFQYK